MATIRERFYYFQISIEEKANFQLKEFIYGQLLLKFPE